MDPWNVINMYACMVESFKSVMLAMCNELTFTLKMEAAYSSEMSIITYYIQYYMLPQTRRPKSELSKP
jgi:hypothetical protein